MLHSEIISGFNNDQLDAYLDVQDQLYVVIHEWGEQVGYEATCKTNGTRPSQLDGYKRSLKHLAEFLAKAINLDVHKDYLTRLQQQNLPKLLYFRLYGAANIQEGSE